MKPNRHATNLLKFVLLHRNLPKCQLARLEKLAMRIASENMTIEQVFRSINRFKFTTEMRTELFTYINA